MALVTLPRQLTVDINGLPRVGALLYVYNAGTNDTRVAYTTKAYSIAHTQPIESVEGGIFPAIYVNPTGGDFKLLITDENGSPIYSEDNIPAQLGATDIDLAGIATQSQSTAIIYSLQRTAAEIAAGVVPVSYAYMPGDIRRYGAKVDGVTDDYQAIQTANDFIEKYGVYGGGPPGGVLSFPTGNIRSSHWFRVGGNVKWIGQGVQATRLLMDASLGSPVGASIELGPDLSGIFGYNGLFTMGSTIENMGIDAGTTHNFCIYSLGAQQGCYLRNLQLTNVNRHGIFIGDNGAGGMGTGGSAGFKAYHLDIQGGPTLDPTDSYCFAAALGSVVELDELFLQGYAPTSIKFKYGIYCTNGSYNIKHIHPEYVSTVVYFPTGGTNATSKIESISGHSSCVRLIHIPSGYTGTVSAKAINGLTGDPASPIAIQNDNTGEALLNTMASGYEWSGDTTSHRSGSFGYSAAHNTPHIRYGKSATQAISQNTVTVLTFPTKTDDWLSVSEWSGSVYTPKIPGRYRVTVSVAMASTAWVAGNRFILSIRKNGVAQSSRENQAIVGTVTTQLQHTDTVNCAAGDTIDTTVFQGVTASLNTDSSATTCYISIDRE